MADGESAAVGGQDPNPALAPPGGARRRVAARMAVQLVGFIVGLGLLGWCASVALSARNREQLHRLGEAAWWEVLGLALLSAASIVVTGAMFRTALLPVRRLRMIDVQAVNAVASVLTYLPFKLSALFRVLIHNRRDGVPALTIGASFGAFGAVAAGTVLPAVAATLWRERVDALWWITALGGPVLLMAAMVMAARFLSRGRVWAWLEGLAKGTRPGRLVVRGAMLERAHEGLRMVASPGAVALGSALRVLDMAILACRFLLAAHAAGQVLPTDQAVLAASVYLMIGALAPMGQLGVREAGTAGVFAALHSEGFVVIVLTVSAVETVTALAMAMAGAAWLKVGRGSLLAKGAVVPGPLAAAPAPHRSV